MKAKVFMKILITGVVVGAMTATAHASFSKKNTYNNQFADVKDTSWYAKEVASSYELGFVEGVSETCFSPDTTVTVAQGITIASRIHAEYNQKTIAGAKDGSWYDAYVDYAKNNGIITKNQFDDYLREIKRYEMAEILHDAMGKDYYNAINDIVFIPDVPVGAFYWDKLITLYNAGVVVGNDEYGLFNPDANIKRSECSAIVNRVAVPENRQKKNLLPFTSENAYVLCYNVGMGGTKENINSGWVFDNRGGPAKLDNSGASAVGDVSEKYPTCFIREFNFIPKGKIVLETSIDATENGAFLEYVDIEGNVTFGMKIVEGKWSVLTTNGYVSTDVNTGSVNIRAVVDLDKGKSKIYFDADARGLSEVGKEFDLLSDNIISYRVGMDEKGTGSVTINKVNMVVNYALYENFDIFTHSSKSGLTCTYNELWFDKDAVYEAEFEEVSDKICYETYFNSFFGFDFIMRLGNILDIESKSGKLVAGGKELYSLTENMWYRLRVEADTNKGEADILLNGRSVGVVSLKSNEPVSKLVIQGNNLKIDNIHVFGLCDYPDYVPEPVTRANFDDFTVGLNICSLWRNGTHYGWACVSAFDEPVPVIGMYDEGLSETADWEIKYMVEHGIDFQAFCWYADQNLHPIKSPSMSDQLHDGYMYAKYSDYMKYCILWEAKSSAHFKSSYFRNYVIPYWFENYFLDPRYMTIDNKLVLPVFSANSLLNSDYFGSVQGVKAELDYLEEVARSYGFDGVLYFASGSSSDILAEMGFDASFAYNWGTKGREYSHNVTSILNSAKNETMYTIPTISVGFDSIPWSGLRHGNMTVEDFARAQEWVKSEYLSKYSHKYSFADNLAWLSTWNEYGEGTYIMPSGLNGFGYVDAVRDAYTDLPSEHEDIVPTLKQKERITHLYPQYARLLRRDGWYLYNRSEEDSQKEAKNKLFINDVDVQENADAMYIVPPMVKDGRILFAFNPASAVNFVLGCHYEYRKDAGTLKIFANGHEVFFKTGYDRYRLDGKEYDLGYTVELFDGLVMLDFEKLAKDLGYKTYSKDGNVYIYTDTYDTLWKSLSYRKIGVWEFNDDYDNEGFTSSAMSIITEDGKMKMTTVTDTYDPVSFYAQSDFPEDFYTKKFTAVELRCRYKYKTQSGAPSNISIYYITDIDSTYNENKSLRFYFDNTDSKGEWVTFRMDLQDEANWQSADRLTGLRFDPFNAQGEMEIDYIRFIEDSDFVYVPLEDRSIEIINGDAQKDVISFYSGNANITKITDPDNKDNHIWKIETHNIANNYTYFRTAVRYKPNTAYKIDYDIKLIGNNKKDGSGPQQTSFNTNFRYADKGAFNDFDHIVQSTLNQEISVSDGWVHYSATYITGKIDSHEKSEFTIYTNPQGEHSFSFCVDNIVVSEIKDYKP